MPPQPKTRRRVVEAFLAGMNTNAIAEMLGITPNAVHNQKVVARRMGELPKWEPPTQAETDEIEPPPERAWQPKDPLDLVPCTRCGLRGHLAGDPDRCLTGRKWSTGLGQWLRTA